jgi:hypothetical protein
MRDVPIWSSLTSCSPTIAAPAIDDDWLPVSDFVEKPVDLDVLLGKVEALLGKAGKDAGVQE